MADRLERVVVQLLEAERLVDVGDLAHSRLALLLFDNLAEVLMHRRCEWHLYWAARMRAFYEHADQVPVGTQEMGDFGEPEPRVSRQRERRIRRLFPEKVGYLKELDVIDDEHGRALIKLHDYRNDAYHQDDLRPETLSTAVRLYDFLCCYLMEALTPMSATWMPSPPSAVASVLGAEHWDPLEAQAAVGRAKRSARTLDDEGVRRLLSDHARSRILDMRDAVEIHSGRQLNGEVLTPEQMLHRCQVEIRTMEDLRNIDSLPAQHDPSDLDAWERRAEDIECATSAVAAMAAFADLEDDFEPLERQIAQMVRAIDEAIQHAIDEARGK